MSASSSIVDRVARTHVIGLALAATSIVIVSAIVGSGVVIWRDDRDAIALGHLLAQELEDHLDNPASYDRVVRHELAEQHWFARRIEVWDGATRYGGAATDGTLASFASRPDGCELSALGTYERICVVHTDVGASVVVGSELAPMLAAMLPMLGAVAIVALLVTITFGLFGRRVIVRSLAPLSRFETEIAGVPARGKARGVSVSWGAAEIDSLATTFNAMLARIDEAIAREQRFVADAAHELRTPLTRLRAQLELAREELRDGKGIDARLVASVRTAVELADTTEALLAMARDTTGKTEPLELADVVETLLARLGDTERARVRVVGRAAVVDGVEPLVMLAAGNLLDNALKYATGAIEVRLEDEDGRAMLRVCDAGPGIAEGELTRIRAPFVRGSSSEGTRGAGLGLALADHVARLHGGVLVLENRAEGGLCASLALRPWQAR
jgi:signal transduction histidine kinase